MALNFSQITSSIKVTVTPEFIEEQSNTSDNLFVWSYHIIIENQGEKIIKLLNRHWKIVDGNGCIQEVTGPGVVGVQPVLQPGEAFEYTSGTRLHTATGIMVGKYEMSDADKKIFDVNIPAFSLDSPHVDLLPN